MKIKINYKIFLRGKTEDIHVANRQALCNGHKTKPSEIGINKKSIEFLMDKFLLILLISIIDTIISI